MRQFDYYEFVGIVTPGAVMLIAVYLAFPATHEILGKDGLTIGEFGLAVILAYVLGFLVQALGSLFENAWWRLWTRPTDLVGQQKGHFLNEIQRAALPQALESKLGLHGVVLGAKAEQHGWSATTRQVYAAVAAAGRAGRADVFNGNYGLSRGLLMALLLALVLAFWKSPGGSVSLKCFLFVSAGLCIHRMHQFAGHYARELFVQFLQLPTPTASGRLGGDGA